MNIRPDLNDDDIDGDNDLSVGPKFLREFEELRKQVADSKMAGDDVDATEATEKPAGGEAAEEGDRPEGESDMKDVEAKKAEMTEADVKGANGTDSVVKVAAAAEKLEGDEESHTLADGGVERNDPDEVSQVGERKDATAD